MIENKGLKFDKAEKFLEEIINEDKIRKSKMDYGLVTVNLKNRVSISLRGLKRLAIENLSQSDVQVISKKLMDIIKESNL